jgi:hypothetical protein
VLRELRVLAAAGAGTRTVTMRYGMGWYWQGVGRKAAMSRRSSSSESQPGTSNAHARGPTWFLQLHSDQPSHQSSTIQALRIGNTALADTEAWVAAREC